MKVPGEMESEVAEAGGADKVLKKCFSYRHPGPLLLPKGQAFKDGTTYPSWMSQEEAAYYCRKFSQSGFTGGFNYYRAINLYFSASFTYYFSITRIRYLGLGLF